MNKRGRKANLYMPTDEPVEQQLNDMLTRWEINEVFRGDFEREAEQRYEDRDE